eukprot:PhF_6_TR40248/c3_g1_i1/m.59890
MSGFIKPSPSVLVEVGPVDNPLHPTVIEPSIQHSKFEPTHTNFMQYVQATWKVAVRYLLPSYLYVLFSIGPCMAVLVPYLYFGLIPFNIDFKGTVDDMSYQSRWDLSILNGISTILACSFFIMLRNV